MASSKADNLSLASYRLFRQVCRCLTKRGAAVVLGSTTLRLSLARVNCRVMDNAYSQGEMAEANPATAIRCEVLAIHKGFYERPISSLKEDQVYPCISMRRAPMPPSSVRAAL